MGFLSDDGLSSSSLLSSSLLGSVMFIVGWLFLNFAEYDFEGTHNHEILDLGSKLAYLTVVNL